MVAIHHEGIAEAPLSVLFAYVDDYRNTTKWLFGLSSFEAVTEQVSGLGTEFDGTFAVKPIKLRSSVRVTEWEQDKVIAMESYKGFEIKTRWNFLEVGAERSKVLVDFEYQLPGGLAGRAMGKAMEPIVALSIRHSDHSLREGVKAFYRENRTG